MVFHMLSYVSLSIILVGFHRQEKQMKSQGSYYLPKFGGRAGSYANLSYFKPSAISMKLYCLKKVTQGCYVMVKSTVDLGSNSSSATYWLCELGESLSLRVLPWFSGLQNRNHSMCLTGSGE